MTIQIEPLGKKDAQSIVDWNTGKNANFLTQWAGRGYHYPLTEGQITTRIASAVADYKIYAIKLDEKLIGTIELMNIDDKAKKAKVGRFLLDPAMTGKGYGTTALKLCVEHVFTETSINTLELTVFDFNKSAIRCYEKTGFTKTSEIMRPNGWIAITMEMAKMI